MGKAPAPGPTPIYKLSIMSMVWSTSTDQPGLAAWLCSLPAPAHLLINWEKSLISQEQLKTSVYYQHSPHTESKTQQLLGKKIIPAETRTDTRRLLSEGRCSVLLW